MALHSLAFRDFYFALLLGDQKCNFSNFESCDLQKIDIVSRARTREKASGLTNFYGGLNTCSLHCESSVSQGIIQGQ